MYKTISTKFRTGFTTVRPKLLDTFTFKRLYIGGKDLPLYHLITYLYAQDVKSAG